MFLSQFHSMIQIALVDKYVYKFFFNNKEIPSK